MPSAENELGLQSSDVINEMLSILLAANISAVRSYPVMGAKGQ